MELAVAGAGFCLLVVIPLIIAYLTFHSTVLKSTSKRHATFISAWYRLGLVVLHLVCHSLCWFH
jgi:hypothetical protein